MECWYCHKETMLLDAEAREGWYKCTECGTTWIDTKYMGKGKTTYAGIPWSKIFKSGTVEAKRKGW